jgi:two-component sensor histidine kinase
VTRVDTGAPRYIEVSAAPIMKAESIEKVAAFFTDVTEEIERDRRMDELRRAQESLLRELHHRVRNNLQLVTGVLELQKAYMLERRDASMLEECILRFCAMSLVQDQVFNEAYRDVLDAEAYLRSVCSIVGSSFERPDIDIEVVAERILIGADQAVPLGILLVELVSNAFTHAFPGPEGGHIAVRLREEGSSLALEVQDDGRGLPGGVDPKGSASLGFQLAAALVSQLGADWEFESKGGTLHRIRFPAASKVEDGGTDGDRRGAEPGSADRLGGAPRPEN